MSLVLVASCDRTWAAAQLPRPACYVTVGGRGVRTSQFRSVAGAGSSDVLPDRRVLQCHRAGRVLVPDGVLKAGQIPVALNFTLAHFGTALFDGVSVRGIISSVKLATASRRSRWSSARPSPISITGIRGRRLLDYLAILPLGLPGTVMAVGILLAFLRLPIPIYGTIWILLAAYVARFVPLATRSVNATFRQIDVSLEEAGRITGASWWVAVRRILFPLSRPGLLVAFLLVFIPSFSELSATILLYAGGTKPSSSSPERSRSARSRVRARRVHDRSGSGADRAHQLAFPIALHIRKNAGAGLNHGVHRDFGHR